MEKILLQILVTQGLSQYEIAAEVGKSQTTVRHWLDKYNLKTNKKTIEDRICQHCGIEIHDKKHSNRLYCSNKCQMAYLRSCRVKKGIASIQCLKKYLFDTRGHKCEICEIEEWCGRPVPLVMDHVDGNSNNNDLENLRLVCGNCDMQLPTYKSKNRGNGRHSRRLRYKTGKSY